MPFPKAILFDYGHTLVNMVGWDEHREKLLRNVRPILEPALSDEPDEFERVALRAITQVADDYEGSYRVGQIDEQVLVELYRRAFQMGGNPLPDSLLEAIADADHKTFGENVTVGPGVPEMLEELNRRGVRLGIVSNNIYLLEKGQATFPLVRAADTYFDTVIFSSDVGKRKPHPSMYQAALKELEVDPSQSVFVGDRVREDVQGPKENGIGAAFLTHEYRVEEDTGNDADGILTRLPDLLELLGD